MLEDLEHGKEITRLTDGLLNKADAAGKWPTRVGDIVAASKLDEPAESPFSPGWLGRAPKYLRKAVELIDSGKIRALLDRREREVHVDPSIDNESKRSFLRLHEVSHDLYPWQNALAYADDDSTLSWHAKRLFEQEANQGAAELLFQGDRFRRLAHDYKIGIGAVAELAAISGASLRATVRRFAETHSAPVCGIVLDPSPVGVNPLTYQRREVSQSHAWTEQFGSTWPDRLSVDVCPFLGLITDPEVGLAGELSWPSTSSEPMPIRADALSNRWAVLILIWTPKRETFKRKRILARAA